MKNREIMHLKVDGGGVLSYPPSPPEKRRVVKVFLAIREAGNRGGSAFVSMKFCMEERL